MQFRVAAPDFSLKYTLESGQAFRWRPSSYGGSYGFIANRAVRVVQEGEQLLIHTADPSLAGADIRHYFALDVELSPILASIDVDAQIHEAIARFGGLRILRQDPWECAAAFICSSFNNIKRIEGMIERLAEAFGTPASFNGFHGCAFPAPLALAEAPERRLRALGLGFRAAYLKSTARLVVQGRLPFDSLRRIDYEAAKTALLACDGVGEKVADCVALFALQKYEAFPVDVWMARSMRYYFKTTRVSPKRMGEFARIHFGRYAGWAQQYLYHYVRTARAVTSDTQQATRVASPLTGSGSK